MSKMYILFFYYKDLILLFFVDQDGMLKNIKKFKSKFKYDELSDTHDIVK